MKIGILGAGFVGAALARLLADAGHEVMVSSRHPDRLTAVAGTAGTVAQACAFGDVCIAAMPFRALGDIPPAPLAGKVVVDAMNYYPERDGTVVELDARTATTSGIVARHLADARVVKGFNAILAGDLPHGARPPVASGRRALPIAGDDEEAKRIVARLHYELGCDALDAGPLAEGWRFERAKRPIAWRSAWTGCGSPSRRRPARARCRTARGAGEGTARRNRGMLYELITVSCPLLGLDRASEGMRAWTTGPGAGGELLGCWRTEIGTLGRIIALRGFATLDELIVERERAVLSSNPLGASPGTDALSLEGHKAFPFLPAVRPARRGRVYEFRTYRLRPGGLSPTLRGWEAALDRARPYADHLVINMFALDGAPRITHIWAFDSLEERGRLRSNAYAAGVWPPAGGPDNIVEATSTIGLPEAFSPLC